MLTHMRENKQTDKQTNKQTNKQTSRHVVHGRKQTPL